MTTLKLATLLMIGATLAATPALAQALTAGNKGPSELPPTRSAPLNLPATTPTPMPKVDTSILGRDIFGLDPALLLESLGTVTLDRSGDITETEASDAQRAIVELRTSGSTGV
jgi:hypothetical protein